MAKVNKSDLQKKIQLLKSNFLFENLSTLKLNKLSLNVKKIKLLKGQSLYREGEPTDGAYMVLSGSVKYQKVSEFLVPISAKTNNKWNKAEVEAKGINRVRGVKDVAIFEK